MGLRSLDSTEDKSQPPLPAVVSELHPITVNTHAIDSGIHCSTVESREGTKGESSLAIVSGASHPITPMSRSPCNPQISLDTLAVHPVSSTHYLAREDREGDGVYDQGYLASSQLSFTMNAAADENRQVRTEDESGHPTGSTDRLANPPVTAAADLGVTPPGEAPV